MKWRLVEKWSLTPSRPQQIKKKNPLKIKSANLSSESCWKFGQPLFQFKLEQFRRELIVQRSLIFRGSHLFDSQCPEKRNYVPGSLIFKSHWPWWLSSSSTGMHVLGWDEFTNERLCQSMWCLPDSPRLASQGAHNSARCFTTSLGQDSCWPLLFPMLGPYSWEGQLW